MKIDIFIFRHGQTDKNVNQVWQGCRSDVLLNATGEKQAEALAEKVRFIEMRLYSSPLLRAVQTANSIARKNFTTSDVTILQDLRECDFGDAEGELVSETEKKYGFSLNDLLFPTEKTADLHFPNGESKREVFNRVYECLMRIVSNCVLSEEGTCVGIVCHAGVLSALAFGLRLKDVSYENCAVLHLQYDMDRQSFAQVVF